MSEQPSPFESPKYLEAVEKERISRDADFLPLNVRIGQFEVRPMTLRHYLILRIMGSPLLGKRLPTPTELAAFLWVLQPDFSTCPKARDKFLKRCRVFIPSRFCKAKKLAIAANIIDAARAYVEETFADAPPPVTNSKATFEKEFYSDAATICSKFAREYGWDDEATLDKPLRRIFQYFKEHRQRTDPKAILFNPSDKVLMEVAS